MRWLAPSLLLAFLVFPGWNHNRPLRRRRASFPGAGAPLSERDGTMSTALPANTDGSPDVEAPSTQTRVPSTGSVGGPPALTLVPPASPHDAAFPPVAAAAGGTYTDDLIRTAFQQLRPLCDARGHGLLDELERWMLFEHRAALSLARAIREDGAA